MTISVDLDELLAACQWIDAGESVGIECGASVDRATGAIHYWGGEMDEEIPPDIDDASLYISVPGMKELDLGRSLVFRFVEENLPRSREAVGEFFRKAGAYARFKSLLVSCNQLDAWHRYEEAATERALGEWCEEHGCVLVRSARS